MPVSMTMAAFWGISWYLCVELGVRLLWMPVMHKKGLYFWACCVASLGVLTQPLFVVLSAWGPLHNESSYLAHSLLEVSWWMMVVPQSVVLYSRLNLVVWNPDHARYVLYMIIFTTVFISFPTMGFGIGLQDATRPDLVRFYFIWDKTQVTVFFVQEVIISLLYIVATRHVLQNRATIGDTKKNIRAVMNHLIWTNVLVVSLDIALLGLSVSNQYFVAGAFRPCVYGVKLRVEFSILNRLVQCLRGQTDQSYPYSNRNSGQSNEQPRDSHWRSTPRDNVTLKTLSHDSEVNILPPSRSHDSRERWDRSVESAQNKD
ncbi:uncharacterized protein BDZ99DRAFT_394960 [Mytilinidion resinicola]|uniref:DUF7703 domain-containing protein n=1 Tax=Mytilinidion resinicola TaxID=574789 RepID=A0A6A6YAJ0_9PEZI|nr:uncharacterized protein BDZ99DRAFT_394960 [Mytilinidion resinicola]KAF2805841.1 hypothetical protein BDZ99DRAFT_394960 [Mytilinidion resinicola]